MVQCWLQVFQKTCPSFPPADRSKIWFFYNAKYSIMRHFCKGLLPFKYLLVPPLNTFQRERILVIGKINLVTLHLATPLKWSQSYIMVNVVLEIFWECKVKIKKNIEEFLFSGGESGQNWATLNIWEHGWSEF